MQDQNTRSATPDGPLSGLSVMAHVRETSEIEVGPTINHADDTTIGLGRGTHVTLFFTGPDRLRELHQQIGARLAVLDEQERERSADAQELAETQAENERMATQLATAIAEETQGRSKHVMVMHIDMMESHRLPQDQLDGDQFIYVGRCACGYRVTGTRVAVENEHAEHREIAQKLYDQECVSTSVLAGEL